MSINKDIRETIDSLNENNIPRHFEEVVNIFNDGTTSNGDILITVTKIIAGLIDENNLDLSYTQEVVSRLIAQQYYKIHQEK